MSKTLMDLLAGGHKLTLQDGNEVGAEDVGVDVDVTVNTDEGGDTDGADENLDNDFGVGDTDSDEAGEGEVDGGDLETELLAVEDSQNQIDETNDALESAEEDVVALQSFYSNIQFTSMTNGAISTAHAELAGLHMQGISRSLGMGDDGLPMAGLSIQNYDSQAGATLATQSAKDSIKAGFVKVLDWILKAIAASIRFVKDLIVRIFNNTDKIIAKANALETEYQKVKNVQTHASTFKSAGAALNLNVNGKTVSAVEASQLVKAAVVEAKGGWAPSKVGQEGISVAEKMTKEAATASAEGLANAFNGNALKAALPFTSKSLSADDAKALGIKLREGDEGYVSERLPRNKAVVTIINKKGNLSIKLAGIKASKQDEARTINIPNMKNGEIETVLKNVIETMKAMESLKQKIEGSKQVKKALTSQINKTRMQYLNVKKMADKGNSVSKHLSTNGAHVSFLKDIVTTIDQPGASLAGYALVECNALLGIVSQSIKSRNKKEEKKDKK